ncbi:MAG: DUF4149 domain-containing protein [Deltaproteobacteria bacterium]|nr:DUF4149 domain-containing protein [Deltaproteobacteria bacterium]
MLKISLFLHIMAAIFWIGGMLFLTLVVAPFLRTFGDESKRREIYQIVGKKYRFFGWIAILILLVTGPINLYYLGVTPAMLFDPSFHSTPYGRAVLLKISFVALIVITSLVHDFYLGPKARSGGGYSWIAMIFGRGNLIIALIIAALAVFIRTGGI